MIAEDPDEFKSLVEESLRRQVAAINSLADVGKDYSEDIIENLKSKTKDFYNCNLQNRLLNRGMLVKLHM